MGGVIIEENIINETMPSFLSVIWLLMICHFVTGMTWMTVIPINVLITSVTMFYHTKAGWIGHDAISVVVDESSGSSYDDCNDHRIPLFNSHHPLYSHSNIYFEGCYKGHRRSSGSYTIFFMFWLPAALHLFSSSQILRNDGNANCCSYDLKSNGVNCDNCCGYSVHCTLHIGIFILFRLFGCYWATQFIIACSSTVIAGSVASYYWARSEISQEIPFLPVFFFPYKAALEL